MSIFTDQTVIENVPVPVDGSGFTQPVSAVSLPLPANAAQEAGGNLASLVTHQTDKTQQTQITDGTNTLGTSAHPLQTISAVAATSTITQVVLTNNTNATLLSANANRKKAILFVPSSTLQIKFGAVASTTSFTYKVTSNNTTIEITGWSGQIDAFGSGQTVTVTELS